jgi:hypothetical protein
MTEEDTITENIFHTELATIALQRAIKQIRYIQETAITVAEFQVRLPVIVAELNKATYYMRNLKSSASPTPLFLLN